MQSICKQEGIEAEEDALILIANKADGALRDALSLFDRLSNVGEKLTYDSVIEQLNILDYDYFFRFVDAFLKEDIEEVLLLHDEVLKKGFEGDVFILGLSEHLRQLLVASSQKTVELLEGSEEMIARYKKQANECSMGFLLTALSLANNCDINYQKAKNKTLHVEICLSKICFMKRAQFAQAPSLDQQKKTPEQKTTPPKNLDSHKEVPLENSPTSIEKVKSQTAHKNIQLPKEAIKASSGADPDAVIPTLESLDDLEKEVQKINEAKKSVVINFSLESIIEDWKEFGHQCSSPSLRTIFNMSELSLKGEVLEVMVPSQVAKDSILQEGDFLQGIREKYHRPNLEFRIEIDEEKAREIQEKSQRPLTFREKYEQMLEANPTVGELQQKFGLQPDHKA